MAQNQEWRLNSAFEGLYTISSSRLQQLRRKARSQTTTLLPDHHNESHLLVASAAVEQQQKRRYRAKGAHLVFNREDMSSWSRHPWTEYYSPQHGVDSGLAFAVRVENLMRRYHE
jgi:hypothetical protein